jgi:hypothetical protein
MAPVRNLVGHGRRHNRLHSRHEKRSIWNLAGRNRSAGNSDINSKQSVTNHILIICVLINLFNIFENESCRVEKIFPLKENRFIRGVNPA